VDETRAQSFLQPWLWLMLEGLKDAENRRQPPWRSVIGQRVAMHASLGWDRDGASFARARVPDVDVQRMIAASRGAIVGTALLVGAVEVLRIGAAGQRHERGRVVGDLTDAQVERVLTSAWTFGPWGLVYEERRKLPAPVPCKGALGFWLVPPDVAARVRELEVSDG
jgi:hypothetical protein